MAVYAVVPVKSLAASKQRLSTVFTPQERKQLTLAMLEDVLKALKGSVVDEVLVVGEDSEVHQTAEEFGAFYLSANRAGLNSAIEASCEWCVCQNATSVLVLPADIPLLSSKEVNRIIELGKGTSAVVLAPSKNWGTNALYQNPPKLIPARFGPKSFFKHIREAYRKGGSVRLHFSQGTSRDIDSAADLKNLLKVENNTSCRSTLMLIMENNEKAKVYFAQQAHTFR
jgi:2-phospho-L-lactate guanylyltransferase